MPLAIGPYKVASLLGAGGMGIVYRAHDDVLERDLALKVLPFDRVTSATARARMLREARAQASLSHANICPIYQSGDDAGRLWIAMELLPGPTLAVRAKTWISDEEILRWSTGIARALAFAHRAGLVHRDLKPANVMLDHTGNVKLVDFGLAKIVEPADTPQSTITEHGAVLGTPRYMSPEQARGTETGPPTDLFSLGLVICELLAAGSPHSRTPPIGWVQPLILNASHPVTREATPKLVRIVADCLAHDPHERPTADAVVARLERLSRARRARPWRRRRYWAVALCSAALVTTAGAYWYAAQPSAPNATVVTDFDPTSRIASAAFDRAGRLYYVAQNPRGRLWRTRPSGGPEAMPGIDEDLDQISCCYRGMLVVSWTTGAAGIEPGTNKLVPLPELGAATAVAPAGQLVAEQAPQACSGRHGFVLRAVGSDMPLVTRCARDDNRFSAYRWAPNGRRFAYVETAADVQEAFVIDLDTSHEPQLVATTPNARLGRPAEGIAWASNDRLLVSVRALRRDAGKPAWWDNAIAEFELPRGGDPIERARHPFGDRLVEPLAVAGNAIAIVETRGESGLLYGDLVTNPPSISFGPPLGYGSTAGWLSDGRVVTFRYNATALATEILLVKPGSAPSVVFPEDPKRHAIPLAITTWEGVEQIVFRRSFQRRFALWIVRVDGTRLRQLISDIPIGIEVACAPQHCVFVVPPEPGEPSKVAKIDLESGQTSELFSFRGGERQQRLAVSPDGRLVAMATGDSKLLIHDRVTNTVEDLHVPGGKAIQSAAFVSDQDLVLTENSYIGGRGLVRFHDKRIVDVLSTDSNWYVRPFVDRTRNRIIVTRSSFPDSLSIIQLSD